MADNTTAFTNMQTRIANAETAANDAKAESSAATSRVALNQNEWSTFKTNMESTLTNNNTTIALLGGQIASLEIPSTNSIAAELKTLGFMKDTDLTADKISTLGFAKTTDVDTKIGLETSARVAAITAEATARTTDITNATSGLIRGENFNTLLSAAATGLGFAKTADVDKKIIDAETAINKATNQKLGTAFGLTVNDDDDIDMTALQTQLQNFAGSTLLTANIISDETEGNQTLTQ